MPDDDKTTQVVEGQIVEEPAPESCGISLADHFWLLVTTIGAIGGTRVRCPEAYRAIVELAEMIRVGGQHEPYTASPDGPGTALGLQLRAGLIRRLTGAGKL
jgi:hypothetical protein